MKKSQFQAKMLLLKSKLRKKQQELKLSLSPEAIEQEIGEIMYVMDVVQYTYINQQKAF